MARPVSRRRAIVAGGGLSLGALLVACGQGAAPTNTPAPAAPTVAPAEPTATSAPAAESTATTAPATEPTAAPVEPTATIAPVAEPTAAVVPTAAAAATLMWWTPGAEAPDSPAWNACVEDYKAQGGAHEIEMVYGDGDEAPFMEKLLASIAAGTPPDGTAFWTTPVAFGVRGALADLTDPIKTSQNTGPDNWPSALLASTQFQGKTYGISMTGGSYGFWYNVNLFEELGFSGAREDFPKTWDEFRAVTAKFTTWEGDKITKLSWPMDLGHPQPYIWSYSNGGLLFDADNVLYAVDSEQNVEMMEYWVKWIDEEFKGNYEAIDLSGPWGTGVGPEGQAPAWQNLRQLMFPAGAWSLGISYNRSDDEFPKPEFNWDLGAYPVGPSGSEQTSGFWPTWCVLPVGTRDLAASFDFLDYLSLGGGRMFMKTLGELPGNKNATIDDVMPQAAVDHLGLEKVQSLVYEYVRLRDISATMWNSPVEAFADDQIGRVVEQILFKVAEPAAALAEAQAASQAELEKVVGGQG